MEKIIKEANALVRYFKTRNPYKISAHLNITVKWGDFKHLKGFYNCIYRNRFIAINSRLDEIEQIITCSHELGHDRLHRRQAKLGLMKDYCIYNVNDKYECEANLFAAQLLISDVDFLAWAEMQYTYAQIASELNVHEELAVIKGSILNRQGYNLNIPYLPRSRYLVRK